MPLDGKMLGQFLVPSFVLKSSTGSTINPLIQLTSQIGALPQSGIIHNFHSLYSAKPPSILLKLVCFVERRRGRATAGGVLPAAVGDGDHARLATAATATTQQRQIPPTPAHSRRRLPTGYLPYLLHFKNKFA